MPGAPGISLEQAAMAVEAVESLGYTHAKAGIMAGFSKQSVGDILSGVGHWGEYVESNEEFRRLRSIQKKAFQVASFELGRQALKQAEANLPKASFLQAVTGYAILRDKERLDAGEPTQIIESIDVRAVAALDRLASLLSQSLVETIDVTPVKTE